MTCLIHVLLVLQFFFAYCFASNTKQPKHKVTKILPGSFKTFDLLRDNQPTDIKIENTFYIDIQEVSFQNFLKFTQFTGYKTIAEKSGWSFVLEKFTSPIGFKNSDKKVESAGHWIQVFGADFKHPFGPVDYENKEEVAAFTPKSNDPVTQVSWDDANAYCNFAINGRLPTEDEWEYAARGGKKLRLYPWGDKFLPKKMNIWNGPKWMELPENDGFETFSPVDSFGSQNKYGLYNIVGNVWEMTSSYYEEDRFGSTGLSATKIFPKNGPGEMVKKGGSFMCHENTCDMYKLHKRSQNSHDSSALNLGFRCVADEIHENMVEIGLKEEL